MSSCIPLIDAPATIRYPKAFISTGETLSMLGKLGLCCIRPNLSSIDQISLPDSQEGSSWVSSEYSTDSSRSPSIAGSLPDLGDEETLQGYSSDADSFATCLVEPDHISQLRAAKLNIESIQTEGDNTLRTTAYFPFIPVATLYDVMQDLASYPDIYPEYKATVVKNIPNGMDVEVRTNFGVPDHYSLIYELDPPTLAKPAAKITWALKDGQPSQLTRINQGECTLTPYEKDGEHGTKIEHTLKVKLRGICSYLERPLRNESQKRMANCQNQTFEAARQRELQNFPSL